MNQPMYKVTKFGWFNFRKKNVIPSHGHKTSFGKKQIPATCHSIDESHKHNVEQKEIRRDRCLILIIGGSKLISGDRDQKND